MSSITLLSTPNVCFVPPSQRSVPSRIPKDVARRFWQLTRLWLCIPPPQVFQDSTFFVRGLPSEQCRDNIVVMKLDGLKFLNTAPQDLQRLVFGGESSQPVTSPKEVALPDAETAIVEVEKVQEELTTQSGCPVPPFEPYTQVLPWHGGTRNMFSKFFPRYGNYCGPNYSSGRESGSHYWDKSPTDWLDYCCYRHDMGYDTLDQTKLLEADREFLTCLQKIPESASISAVGRTYQNLYIFGLERFLVPYRDILVKKIEDGKRGRETAPAVIVEEVKTRNAEMERSS